MSKTFKGGISAMVAVLLATSLLVMGCASAQGVYLNSDGSTFTRSFSGLFSVKAPSYITDDTFLQSEIVRTSRVNQTKTYQEPSWSGVRSSSATGGAGIYEPPQIGRTYQIIETYEVTTTRHWYNRTTYYQNQKPTYSKVYKDEETRRLINTEKRYLN